MGTAYAAPSAGGITAWGYRLAAGAPGFMRLHVARRTVGDDFLTVARSERELPLANQQNTFPTRISVRAGDVIGTYHTGPQLGFFCLAPATSGSYHAIFGDPPPGATTTFLPGNMSKAPVTATLEPDADGDGFGDETQDACPGDTFTVFARDVSGNIDETPATYSWTPKQPKKK